MSHAKNGSQEPQDFFDKPRNITWILRVFYALCAVLAVADFIVHRHIYVGYERIPAFYALYGFVACVMLVLLAKVMRKVLMREETYYGDNSEDWQPEEEDKP